MYKKNNDKGKEILLRRLLFNLNIERVLGKITHLCMLCEARKVLSYVPGDTFVYHSYLKL